MNDVYLLYDRNGALLYIGCSAQNGLTRAKQHRAFKPWGREIRRVDFRHYKSYDRACAVEERAIKLLNPKYNIVSVSPTRKGRRHHKDIEADKLERIKAIWLDPLLSERDRIQQCSAIAGRNLTRGWLHGRFPRGKQ